VRDGVPLPGRFPTEVLSQLADRVFGPLHPDRVRVVLDYHGMDGNPPGASPRSRPGSTSRPEPCRGRAGPVPGSC